MWSRRRMRLEAIRAVCGPNFLIVVPGVSPANSSTNDQSRVATPGEAIRAGADYLVIGRPISGSPNPREAANKIVEEMVSAARKNS